MQFELVDNWLDFSGGEDFLQLHLGEVRYTDGSHFAIFVRLLHLFPCVSDRPRMIYVTCPVRKKGKLWVVSVWIQLVAFTEFGSANLQGSIKWKANLTGTGQCMRYTVGKDD